MIEKYTPIIDFGCGSGQFDELAIKGGWKYRLGLDFSKIAVNKAKERNSGHIEHFMIGNLYSDDLWHKINNTFYGVAVFCEVLEHLYKDKWVLNQIQSGKRIVFTVPNFDCDSHVRWFDTMDDVRGRYEGIIDIEWIESKVIGNTSSKIFIASGVKK